MLATLTFKSKKTSPEEDTDTRTMRQAYVVIKKQFGYTCTHPSPTCFPYLVRMQDFQAAMLNAPRWPMCMHCESPQLAAPKWQYSFTSLFFSWKKHRGTLQANKSCYKYEQYPHLLPSNYQFTLALSCCFSFLFQPNPISWCLISLKWSLIAKCETHAGFMSWGEGEDTVDWSRIWSCVV